MWPTKKWKFPRNTQAREKPQRTKNCCNVFCTSRSDIFSLTHWTHTQKNKNRKMLFDDPADNSKAIFRFFFLNELLTPPNPLYTSEHSRRHFHFRREHEVTTRKWVVQPFCMKQPRAKSIPLCLCVFVRVYLLVYIMLKCMCKLLCVSLPVALARLLPPPRLYCPQTDCSPTAAPAHCFNMFWQRRLFYRGSRRPSAVQSVKLRCAKWLGSLRGETWLFFLFVCLLVGWRKQPLCPDCDLKITKKRHFSHLVLSFKPLQIPQMLMSRYICFFNIHKIFFIQLFNIFMDSAYIILTAVAQWHNLVQNPPLPHTHLSVAGR